MKFYYSSYWNTWSRRLYEASECGPFVDVELTPTGGWDPSAWEEVRKITISTHRTLPAPGDLIVNELPEEVREIMIDNLGEKLVGRLLTEGFRFSLPR